MQLEAAERAERRSTLGPPHEAEGYAREDLLAAAREVGIDPAFLSVALAELGRDGALVAIDGGTDRAATRWLGTRTRSFSASRRFAQPAAVVWPALALVFEGPDFGLRLDGSDGGHPLAGGVARFHMMRLREMVLQRRTYTMLCYRMEQLDISDLRVTLRADAEATEVTVFGDLRAGVRRNLRWGRVSGGVLGALAGAGALALGLAGGPVIAAAACVLGGLCGTGATVGLWRLTYRSALAQVVLQIERTLAELERSLHRDALFSPAADTPASQGARLALPKASPG